MKKWDEMEGYEKIELADDIEQILSQDDIVDIWNEYYKDDEVMQIEKIDDGYFIEGYYGGHYFERITQCRDFNEQIFDDIYDKLAEFVATSYTNEEVKRRLSVKKYYLQKLNEIIKYGDKVQFTQTPTIEEDNPYIEVEEGIEYHLVYYFKEPYAIHFAFIHHYNKDNEYIDTYRVYMDVEEAEEIFEMCNNYNNLQYMEELYNKVYAELERQRIEENKKFYDFEDVGLIVSKVYEDYEETDADDVIKIVQQIWDRYVEYLKTIDSELEILDEDTVGLKGWSDFSEEEDIDYEDEGICLGEGIEYEEDDEESLENAINQLMKKIEMLSGQDDNNN